MDIKEIIQNHYNKPKEKPREIGKYHASEIWGIKKGYTTTGNFFTGKPVDAQGAYNMFWGSAGEDFLGKIFQEGNLDFTTQDRLEVKVNDWYISGKVDFNFPAFILETKCPKEATTGIPDKCKDQMEFYHRATGKPVNLGIFSKNGGNTIINFYPYEPEDQRWDEIKVILQNFHNKLLKKHGKK